MIPSKVFVFLADKKKRKIEQLDDFGYLLEKWQEDEYTEIEG